uniref:Uncharacterized protein LOC114342707 isoform X1 n=1 Tax=Diabrotica virgifera virgifera TaxID=50390 RepID=A0A6P7GZV5_DIAVI
MIKMMREVMWKNDEMMAEIRTIRKDQKETMEYIRELKEKNKKLEGLKMATKRIEQLEKDRQRNNIVLKGLTLDPNDRKPVKESVEHFIGRNLKLQVKLRGAVKIGDQIFVAEMENLTDKLSVLKNKGKLKNLQGQKVYIESDLTRKEREIQAKIRKMAKEEKDKGNTTKIGYMKLEINGKEWKWDHNNEKIIQIHRNIGDTTPKK